MKADESKVASVDAWWGQPGCVSIVHRQAGMARQGRPVGVCDGVEQRTRDTQLQESLVRYVPQWGGSPLGTLYLSLLKDWVGCVERNVFSPAIFQGQNHAVRVLTFETARAIELLRQGETFEEVGMKMHMTRRTISSIAKAAGIRRTGHERGNYETASH